MCGCAIYAVVKADCYGNGVALCPYIESYVDGFAVAYATEGARLRELGISKPILVLTYEKSQEDLARKCHLSVSLSSKADYAKDLDMHIACDTGMNRLGFKDKEEIKSLLVNHPNNIIGLYSHIFDNRESNIARQWQSIEVYRTLLDSYGYHPSIHIASSTNYTSSILSSCDIVRYGIGMYLGAVSLVSDIILTKRVYAGESVGYDGEYVAKQDEYISICRGGYADGILRAMSGGLVGINGELYPIVGKISMDTFAVSTGDKAYNAGDMVVIVDNECLTWDKWSEHCHMSIYELMTGLKGRFDYVYFH